MFCYFSSESGIRFKTGSIMNVGMHPFGSKEVAVHRVAGAGLLMAFFSEGVVTGKPIIHIRLLNGDNRYNYSMRQEQEIYFETDRDGNFYFLFASEIIDAKCKAGKRFLSIRDFLTSTKRIMEEWENSIKIMLEEGRGIGKPLINFNTKIVGLGFSRENFHVQIEAVKVFDMLGDYSHIEYKVTQGIATEEGDVDTTQKMIVERFNDLPEALKRFKRIAAAIDWIENNNKMSTHSKPLALLSLALETLYGKLPPAEKFSVRLCREILLRKLVA